MNAKLREAGLPPDLVAELDLREQDGILQIPYGRHGRQIAEIGYEVEFAREVDDWPAGEAPGAWWPINPEGASTIVITAGAGDALTLASCTHGVDGQGQLRPKANLPNPLRDLVPVALPGSDAGLPLEWMIEPTSAVEELWTELMRPTLSRTYLSFPRPLVELQEVHGPLLEAFVNAFLDSGSGVEVTPVPALIPPATSWQELLAPFRGAARTAALAGVLEFWRLMALAEPR
jgi:hypothetical protein